MSSLDRWVIDAAGAVGVPATDVPADLRHRLLDLGERLDEPFGSSAGTMTGFLVGVAVGRGVAPAVALAALEDLLRGRAAADTADDGAASDRAANDSAADAAPGPTAPGGDDTVPAARDRDTSSDTGAETGSDTP